MVGEGGLSCGVILLKCFRYERFELYEGGNLWYMQQQVSESAISKVRRCWAAVFAVTKIYIDE